MPLSGPVAPQISKSTTKPHDALIVNSKGKEKAKAVVDSSGWGRDDYEDDDDDGGEMRGSNRTTDLTANGAGTMVKGKDKAKARVKAKGNGKERMVDAFAEEGEDDLYS
jgi:hypothetical protein